jgi:phosphoglycolate phosphatase
MQLFFDFDGTLADSSPGIYASFEFACTRLNLEPPAFKTFRETIGPPVQRLAQRFFPDLSESDLEAFRLFFRGDYDHNRFRQCDWYTRAKPTISALAALPGANLAIVTNKPTDPTLELLKTGDLLGCFQLVVGIDYQICQGSGSAFANKADAIRFAKAHLEPEASAAVYIGDTPSDRDASYACGLQFIAATYGFHRWQQSELCAIMSISAISDLIPLLQDATGGNAKLLTY